MFNVERSMFDVQPPAVNPDAAIERLYNLNVDTTTRDGDGTPHEKPHKPLLLLAAFDLIDEGLATPERIPWCQELRDRFSARFLLVRKLNDHPTNGPLSRHSRRRRRIALCKNHHWAMDRDIIAPGPDLHWHVSKVIDPRRSNGERELADLAGKSLLLPKDPAFHPGAEGLIWRCNRLSA
jgi:predicted restriction endonuclease